MASFVLLLSIYKLSFKYVLGVRFRRQHWCLLSIILLIIILSIAIGLPIKSSSDDGGDGVDGAGAESGDSTGDQVGGGEVQVSIPQTHQARMKAVKQLLKDVPLIDG